MDVVTIDRVLVVTTVVVGSVRQAEKEIQDFIANERLVHFEDFVDSTMG